jgi:hypothetical protein
MDAAGIVPAGPPTLWLDPTRGASAGGTAIAGDGALPMSALAPLGAGDAATEHPILNQAAYPDFDWYADTLEAAEEPPGPFEQWLSWAGEWLLSHLRPRRGLRTAEEYVQEAGSDAGAASVDGEEAPAGAAATTGRTSRLTLQQQQQQQQARASARSLLRMLGSAVLPGRSSAEAGHAQLPSGAYGQQAHAVTLQPILAHPDRYRDSRGRLVRPPVRGDSPTHGRRLLSGTLHAMPEQGNRASDGEGEEPGTVSLEQQETVADDREDDARRHDGLEARRQRLWHTRAAAPAPAAAASPLSVEAALAADTEEDEDVEEPSDLPPRLARDREAPACFIPNLSRRTSAVLVTVAPTCRQGRAAAAHGGGTQLRHEADDAARLPPGPILSVSDAIVHDYGLGRAHFQVKLSFHEGAEFWSHFLHRERAPVQPKPQYTAAVLVHNAAQLFDLVSRCGPLQELAAVHGWQTTSPQLAAPYARRSPATTYATPRCRSPLPRTGTAAAGCGGDAGARRVQLAQLGGQRGRGAVYRAVRGVPAPPAAVAAPAVTAPHCSAETAAQPARRGGRVHACRSAAARPAARV